MIMVDGRQLMEDQAVQSQDTKQESEQTKKPLKDTKTGKALDAVAGVIGLPHVSSNK